MTSYQARWPGVLMAITSAICYSTLSIFVKLAYSYQLSVTTIIALRMVFASVFLWLTLLASSRNRWRLGRKDWPGLFFWVILAYAGSELAYFMGLRSLPAGVAIFLVYIYPVLVVFMVFLLYGERPTLRKLGVGLICFLGCGVLSWEPGGTLSFPLLGIGYVLFAAIAIALYTTYSQRLLKSYSPLTISAWTMPPIGIFFLFLDWNNLPRYADIPFAAWLLTLATGFLATYMALLLYLGAIGRIGAAHASLICTIEPVSTALLAAWILGERLSLWQMFGAALILGGLLVLEWPGRREA